MMDSKIGRYDFAIESAACDFEGKAPLTYLCSLLLTAAGLHADDKSFGFTQLAKQNKAWVISRIGLYVNHYPQHEEIIHVETWIENIEKYFTRRCFAVLDKDNKEIGYAQTIWAAIDMQTRRPCNIADLGSNIMDYLGADKSFPVKKMGKIGAVDKEALFLHSPKYSDIDINKHFNSVKYIEHMLDMFDFKVFESKMIRSFEIVYLAEALPENVLAFHWEQESDNQFLVDIKNNENKESVCRASLVFGEK